MYALSGDPSLNCGAKVRLYSRNTKQKRFFYQKFLQFSAFMRTFAKVILNKYIFPLFFKVSLASARKDEITPPKQ